MVQDVRAAGRAVRGSGVGESTSSDQFTQLLACAAGVAGASLSAGGDCSSSTAKALAEPTPQTPLLSC